MNESLNCPRNDARRSIQVVSVAREIFVARNHNRWTENPRRHEKRLMINELLSEMLRQGVRVRELLQQKALNRFRVHNVLQHVRNWHQLVIVQDVLVDFLVDLESIAIGVKSRDVHE